MSISAILDKNIPMFLVISLLFLTIKSCSYNQGSFSFF